MKKEFYAHSKEGEPPENWHRLEAICVFSALFIWLHVAPHVGAWIETCALLPAYRSCPVAPHMDAGEKVDLIFQPTHTVHPGNYKIVTTGERWWLGL